MSDELTFRVGSHDADIRSLKDDMKATREDVAAIRAVLEQAKGGWKTLMVVGSISSALTIGIAKALAFLKGGQS